MNYYECVDCHSTEKASKCSRCGHEALRMIQLFEKGDIVEDDRGNILVITSGNKKYAESASKYDLDINIYALRAKKKDYVSNQLFPDFTDGDFLWYEKRIVAKIIEKESANV